MSSAQSLNIAQAIDIVIGFHDENIAIAAVILDQVMDHLVTLGFPSSPVLWPRAAEELVTKTHRDYKINALRVLRTSVALVRCSGGLDSLVDQVDTSLNMGDEVAEMFNQLADLCSAHAERISLTYLQALEEMLLSIEESLCKVDEAINFVRGFIDAKGEHVKLLGHLQATAHFDRIASSLQGPPPAQELSAVARDALNVLRLTLNPLFSLVDRSGEEVERVVAELRSLGVEEVNRGVVDDKMTGLVRIRDDLGVLQEAQPARLATFSRTLQSPAAVPTSIRDEAFDVDLEILDAMTVSLTFAQAEDIMKEVVSGLQQAKALIQRWLPRFSSPGVYDLPQE